MHATPLLDRTLLNWRWLAAASWVTSCVLYLTLPPSPDQFSHAYMGWRLLEGDVPYRDFFDQNWPGVVGLHALAIELFGVNLWSWRAFDFLLFAGSAIALGDLVRLAVNRDAQKLSLILFPLIYVGANYWIAGQHDMSAAQFLVCALWFNVRAFEKRSGHGQFFTGLFVALAILNKPTVGFIGLLLPLQALWLGATLRTVSTHTLIFTVSVFAVLLAIFTLVLAQGATVRDISDLLYAFNLARREVHAQSIWSMAYGVLSGSRHPWWFPSLLVSLPAAIWLLRHENRTSSGVSLLTLWVTGLMSYFIQGSGVGYHLAPSFIAMAAANTVSVYLIGSGRIGVDDITWRRRLGFLFIAATLAMIGAKLLVAYYSLPIALVSGSFKRHWARFPTGNGDVTVEDTVAFINRMRPLAPSDCILVLGNDSALSYLSQHRQPTRFYYFDVLANTHPSLPMAARWLLDWDNDLRMADCPIVLIRKDIIIKWLPRDEPASSSLRSFLKQYRQVGTLGANYGDIVFERK